MTAYVHHGGLWQPVKQLYVKDNGEWVSPKEAFVKDGGVWKRFYPDPNGAISYTEPGTYTFTVPYGITSLIVTIVGGGGGGGGYRGNGDGHSGGSGGSGGKYVNTPMAVSPGETLTIVVGAGGLSASVQFNGTWLHVGGRGTGGDFWNAGDGGASSISRGSTPIGLATGGYGGWGAGPGDNHAPDGASRPGGNPDGVAGPQPPPYRSSGYVLGGNNGTGHGTGGWGNAGYFNSSLSPMTGPGGNGFISITW